MGPICNCAPNKPPYEKIMSVATSLSNCNLIILNIFSYISQVAMDIVFS